MNSHRLYRIELFAQRSWLVVAVLLFAGLTSLQAQQTTGSIVGTVKDQSGAVVNTATVKATNLDTAFSRSAPTNGYGQYRIDYLPVGRYTVEVKASGFERFVQENIALTVDQTQTIEITLSVGSATETVTVTEAPPLVNTSDAVLGGTLVGEEILGTPLVNRNVYSEIGLTPGVMANNNSPTSNPTGSPNFTVGLPYADVQINGSIDGGNPEVAFYLDGGNNITGMRNYGNPAPNPDALEEFRVETSAFGAQYGQFSAAVITVITKSGTNKFHGSLFEFNRNTDFNAYPWTAGQGAPAVKLPYHRNQFGGTVGGPIIHDKAFFFFSYAGLRQVAGQQLNGAIVPTAAERLGDFTGDTFTVNTPGTKTQVNGTNSSPGCQVAKKNCIPQALLDTTISNFDNVSNTFGSSIPLPNGAAKPATGGGGYTGVYSTPTTANEYLGKYDQVIGDKDHATVTFFFVRNVQGNNPGGNVPWTINQSAANQWNANISDVHTFNANIANQAWLTFTRAAGGRVNLPQFGCGLRSLVFAPNTDALVATVKLRVIQGLTRWLAGVVNVVDVGVSDQIVSRGLTTVSSILKLGIERGEFRPIDIDNVTRCIVWPMLMANLWTQSLGIYAVGIDLTRRDMQAEAKKMGRPWDMSKGFDNSAPIGLLTRGAPPRSAAAMRAARSNASAPRVDRPSSSC